MRLSTRPELTGCDPMELEEDAMGDLIEGALVRRVDRRTRAPRNLAEELGYLDAYGRPFPGGMLEALIQDSDAGPAPEKPAQCEIIYWPFSTAADRRAAEECSGRANPTDRTRE